MQRARKKTRQRGFLGPGKETPGKLPAQPMCKPPFTEKSAPVE
jgi:hypothetical protein